MDTITMEKSVLIKEIKANMETHQETYEKAVSAFRVRQENLLVTMLAKAERGEEFDRLALSRLPVPENHISDYKVALSMLGHEIHDEIEISPSDYRRYVLDEWEWQHSWTTNSLSYVQ